MLPAAAALTAALLLAGCAPSDPIITPEPVPDSTPVFASDEEALAAASEAYGKYLAVSDEISADGGDAPERLAPLVTAGQLKVEVDAFSQLAKSESKTRGRSEFQVIQMQRYEDHHDGSANVSLYVCLDVSKVRVVDSSGNDITLNDRVDRVPLEVGFHARSDNPPVILIERSETWSGKDFCN